MKKTTSKRIKVKNPLRFGMARQLTNHYFRVKTFCGAGVANRKFLVDANFKKQFDE